MSDARLSELAREGAKSFDPEGFRFAERLVAAGLQERAGQWIDKLRVELRAARDALEHAIDKLASHGVELEPVLVTARATGDLRTALRIATRLERRNAGSSSRTRWALSVAARARARGVRLPEELAFRLERLERSPTATSESHASELANAISRALFVDSVVISRATLAIAHATDNVPDESGPYNCHAIAARVLAELATLAPDYARALVASLDDLAALDNVPLAPTPKSSGRRKQ